MITPQSVLLCLLTVLCGSAFAEDSAQEIIFTCPAPTNSPEFKIFNSVYSHFFDHLNLSFSMISATEKRAIHALLDGSVDGICGKSIKSLDTLKTDQLYPSSTPLAEVHVKALAPARLGAFDSLNELTQTNYRIGIIEDTLASREARLHDIDYIDITSVDRGIRMLAANRLDLVITNKLQIQRNLDDIKPTSQLRFSKTLFIVEVHPALHRRHHAILPKLNQYISALTHCMDSTLSHSSIAQWISLSNQSDHFCLNLSTKDIPQEMP